MSLVVLEIAYATTVVDMSLLNGIEPPSLTVWYSTMY
jgi:hypothetical protein